MELTRDARPMDLTVKSVQDLTDSMVNLEALDSILGLAAGSEST